MSLVYCRLDNDRESRYYNWIDTRDEYYLDSSNDAEERTIRNDNLRLECAGLHDPAEVVPPSVDEALMSFVPFDADAAHFLQKNQDVRSALLFALPLLGEVFGAESEMSLVKAPGFDGSESEYLVCYIKCPTDIQLAIDRLSTFRRNWRSVYPEVKDKLSFNIQVD